MKRILLIPLGVLTAVIGVAFSQNPAPSPAEARRVEVLFLGAPTRNHPAHDPVERYRVLKKALGADGIDLTYSETLEDIRGDVLNRYDAVMFYGNWEEKGTLQPARFKALTDYVDAGHGFLPIHCASACFGGSDDFSKLVGGHFKSHQSGVFTTAIVDKEHPVMRGYEGFETWDETYVHDRLTDDRSVLQVRDKEPWTWVRNQGKGKVFYTAYGHDMRCWDQPAFHELLRRAILWSVGAEVRAKLGALKLPTLEQEDAILPGYRDRKTITKAQKPLPPEESVKLAQVPPGFELELFASDPDIVNPIYITWDHKGRAYVIETVDYPNNLQKGDLGHDRIHLCEDTNGDGKADKFTLFAEKLSIPTSAVFVNGGLVCTNGPDMIFLKDTDGDGKADVRKVLFSGFGMGDTHAGVSNLRIGLDNWVYATVGYSGFNGTVGGETLKFQQAVFRFKPDGGKMEFIQNTTNNTWGLGFTSAFDVMGSTANANPSFFVTFPKEAYEQAGLKQPRTPAGDNNPKFFPSSMDIRQVDQFDRYTAAAGHAFYTSERFPAEWRDQIAFVTEPTGKLVAQFRITPKGAGYVSDQLPNNLYNSADAWSGPVQAETGPDGAVWVADWYNLIIQHNPTPSKGSAGYDAEKGKGNAYETPMRDKTMGRIYRIFPKGTQDDANPKLDPAKPDTLIAALSHPNLFWRQQAQNLIVESKSTAAVAKLKALVSGSSKRAATHAVYTLAGLGALDAETLKLALASDDRGLFRAGLANSPADDSLASAVIQGGVVKAPDARLLAETFVALSNVKASDAVGKALHATLLANKDAILGDVTLNDAWQMAARRHATGVVLAAAADPDSVALNTPVNLVPNPGFDGTDLGVWSLRTYSAESPDTIELSVGPGGRNGGNALKIASPSRADVGAGATFAVKPGTRYRFSGWIRTEKMEKLNGLGALFNVHEGTGSKAVGSARDWQELSFEFDSGRKSEVLIHCLFGGFGGSIGTAYYDDLSLTEITSGSTAGVIDAVVRFVADKGDPALRKSLADALATRPDEFSKGAVKALSAAPAVVKTVVRKFQPDPAVHERGLAVYSHTCIACHGPDGKGVAGAFPPLDGASWVTGDPSIPARIVLLGLQGPIEVSGQKFESVMPPLVDLKDDEIADVLTYVRQNWSNDASPVSAGMVKEARAKYMSHGKPFTAAELK